MIKLAQIGCGYWGPNLLRNFNSLKNCKVLKIVEPNKEGKNLLQNRFHTSI